MDEHDGIRSGGGRARPPDELDSPDGQGDPADRHEGRRGEPEAVRSDALRAVIEQLMPRELELRGINEPEPVCAAVIESVAGLVSDRGTSNPDEVFGRLAGD